MVGGIHELSFSQKMTSNITFTMLIPFIVIHVLLNCFYMYMLSLLFRYLYKDRNYARQESKSQEHSRVIHLENRISWSSNMILT